MKEEFAHVCRSCACMSVVIRDSNHWLWRRLTALKHASEERGLQWVNHLASNQSNEYSSLSLSEFRIQPTGTGQEDFPICSWLQTVILSFSREVEDWKKTPANYFIKIWLTLSLTSSSVLKCYMCVYRGGPPRQTLKALNLLWWKSSFALTCCHLTSFHGSMPAARW